MAVKLRLKRMGAKQKPYYRIVAADSKSPRDGRFIEVVGNYNPLINQINLDEEKILKWLNNGAQPTDTVKSILSNAGVWSKFKVNVAKPAKKIKKATEPAKEEAGKPEVEKKSAAKKATTTTKKAPAPKTTTTKAEKSES